MQSKFSQVPCECFFFEVEQDGMIEIYNTNEISSGEYLSLEMDLTFPAMLSESGHSPGYGDGGLAIQSFIQDRYGKRRVNGGNPLNYLFAFPLNYTYSTMIYNDEFASFEWGVRFQTTSEDDDPHRDYTYYVFVTDIRIGFGSGGFVKPTNSSCALFASRSNTWGYDWTCWYS